MSTSRRGFLLSGSAAILGLAAQELGALRANPAGGNGSPDLLLHEDEGEVLLIGPRQGRVVIKVDRAKKGIEQMSLVTEDIRPGDGIPVHKHGREEEFIYIAHGTGVLTFGADEHPVAAGAMGLVPRGEWHGLQNTGSEQLRMVFGYTPAGFESYFREIGVPPGHPPRDLSGEDWARINADYQISYR